MFFAGRKRDGKKIGHVRARPASIRQRKSPAKKQHAPSPPVDELANELLLRKREITGLHRTKNERLVAEEVFGPGREALGEFLGIVDTLAVNLVLGGAQHGDDLHVAVVVFGAADKFVLPPRFAFHIENAAFGSVHVHQPRHGIVGAILFALQRLEGKLQRLCAGGARIEQQVFGLDLVIRRERDLARSEDFVPVAYAERRFAPRKAALMEADARGKPRIRKRARGHDSVVDFHVVGSLFESEAYGVNRNAAVSEGGNRVGVDSAGIVRAVAQEHHRAHGQVGGFRSQLLQTVIDARRGCDGSGLQFLGIPETRETSVQAVEARLEFLLQLGERAVLKGLGGLRFARRALIRDAHAARIVDEHGDNILLRLQLGHGNGRLPQKHKHHRGQEKFQEPDNAGPPVANRRRGFRQPRPDQKGQPHRRRQHQQKQKPLRPAPEKDELALRKNRRRILE